MAQSSPLDHFPLAWRWTNPEHAILPATVLAQIHPLSPEDASDLAASALLLCRGDIAEERFPADGDAVTKLASLPIGDDSDVLISWDEATAISTKWVVFRERWADFCYPASDDVTIWAPGAGWSLCYFHYELFVFRRA